MNQKHINIFLCIFLLILGSYGLYSSISIMVDSDSIKKGYVLAHSNPFIRFSPSLCLGTGSFSFLIIPYLYVRNYLPVSINNLTENDEFMKAKQAVMLYILFLPSLFFLIISIYFSNWRVTNYPLLIFVLIGVLYTPFLNIFKFFKLRDR